MIASARGILIVLFCLILAACSASSRIVKNYDGPQRPISQVSRLVIPGDIQLLEIDGLKQREYLLENIDITYELVPGRHRLLYRFTSIWTIPGANVETQEDKVETIESGLRELVFDFRAGETYTLAFDRPGDRAEARQFATAFSATLTTESGQRVAQDVAYSGEDRPAVAAAVPPPAPPVAATSNAAAAGAAAGAVAGAAVTAPSVAAPGVPVAAPETTDLSRIEALKVMWSQASAEEKREFLRWAFQ